MQEEEEKLAIGVPGFLRRVQATSAPLPSKKVSCPFGLRLAVWSTLHVLVLASDGVGTCS